MNAKSYGAQLGTAVTRLVLECEALRAALRAAVRDRDEMLMALRGAKKWAESGDDQIDPLQYKADMKLVDAILEKADGKAGKAL